MSLISRNEDKIYANDVIGNVRKAQEDSHGYKIGTPNGDLFVVCDGMGGHVGGATASRIAVESIVSYIDEKRYDTPIEALDGALQFANMQILGHANANPELKGMGTTACIVLIQDDGVWIAHVGDSRIYLYQGKEQQLHRITKDHSYVQTLVDAGEITDDEAEHHPNKNRILKALGIKPELQPTFNFENRPIRPKNGDIFMICSDGLSGMIPDRTIERVMGENLTVQQKGDRLIELAMQGETVVPGGQDNCTLEMIEIDNSPWGNSEFKSYNPYQPTVQKKETKEQELIIEKPKTKDISKKVIVLIAAILIIGASAVIIPQKIHDKRIKETITSINETKRKLDEANEKLLTDQGIVNELKKKGHKAENEQLKVEKDNKTINALSKDLEELEGKLKKLNK